MSNGLHPSHTTEREKEFILNLGMFASTTRTRKQLLEGYIAGAKKRVKWDGIDGKDVLSFARQELARA